MDEESDTLRKISLELWDQINCIQTSISTLDLNNEDENIKSHTRKILKCHGDELEKIVANFEKAGKEEREIQQKLTEVTNRLQLLAYHASKMIDNINAKEENKPKEVVSNAASTSNSASSTISLVMSPVHDEEFHSVSSYMKGRLTLPQINHFIELFNTSLLKKYEIVKKPKKTLKMKERTLQDLFKKQNTDLVKGMYFVTIDDMKQFSGFKASPTNTNIITILRHLKKIKEIREPQLPIRYAAQF